MNSGSPELVTEPLVTVAIAAYNAGRYLLPSINSVLGQTYSNIEVIVVDDGSDDGSVDALSSIGDDRLKCISQPNQGKSVALNLARSKSEGEYFVIHDGDDLSHPERIARQVEFMETNPWLGAAFSRHDLLLDDQRFAPRRLALSPQQCADFVDDMSIPAIDPTGIYRSSATKDLDYEPSLRIGQGVDYMLRVGELHPIAVMGESLYSYRIDPSSTTRRSPADTHEYIQRVRQRACQRRGVPFEPDPPPPPGRARHAFFGHILEASIENALAGDRSTTASIAWTTLRHARLGLDGFKPALVTVLPTFVLKKMRPMIDRKSLVEVP